MRPPHAIAAALVVALVGARCLAGPAPSGPSHETLARLHAPFYRFNAWIPGNDSPGNKNEDYFPMAVGSWLNQLASRRARVVTTESSGPSVAISQTRPIKGTVVIEPDAVHGVPGRMAGDIPGQAPLYFHIYEEKKVENPDGSGEDDLVIEYWLFYGQDASRDRVTDFGFVPTMDLAGHKGDWEQMSIAIAVLRGAGGAFLRSEPRRAYYTAHGDPHSVELSEFERTDDTGAVSPGGTHPIVYIAMGKHPSYPQPGWWKDPNGYAPFVTHDEFFLGNGFQWRSWESAPLENLDAKAGAFASRAWQKLLAPGLSLPDWRDYRGTFGDDRDFKVPLIGITFPTGTSPRAPRFQSSYSDLAKNAKPWADEKRTASGLHLGPSPLVNPAPLPRRYP